MKPEQNQHWKEILRVLRFFDAKVEYLACDCLTTEGRRIADPNLIHDAACEQFLNIIFGPRVEIKSNLPTGVYFWDEGCQGHPVLCEIVCEYAYFFGEDTGYHVTDLSTSGILRGPMKWFLSGTLMGPDRFTQPFPGTSSAGHSENKNQTKQ